MSMFTPQMIADLRARLGLSVVDFAAEVGRRLGRTINRQTIYNWESGHSHPRYKETIALNELLKSAGSLTAKVG